MLEKLASRFRPTGLCLMALQRDGSLVYSDPVAGASSRVSRRRSFATISSLPRSFAGSHQITRSSVFDSLPGILLAVCPCVERRQVTGIVGLAA